MMGYFSSRFSNNFFGINDTGQGWVYLARSYGARVTSEDGRDSSQFWQILNHSITVTKSEFWEIHASFELQRIPSDPLAKLTNFGCTVAQRRHFWLKLKKDGF